VGERSVTMDRLEAEWASAPDAGDRMNSASLDRFRAMPLDEVRALFRTIAGELRGYLTVVPESRWIKHAAHQQWFFEETIEHYEDHATELAAILRSV
jgi:hypothetical protein